MQITASINPCLLFVLVCVSCGGHGDLIASLVVVLFSMLSMEGFLSVSWIGDLIASLVIVILILFEMVSFVSVSSIG